MQQLLHLSEDGQEQAGMGPGIGDFDTDGALDIFKTQGVETRYYVKAMCKRLATVPLNQASLLPLDRNGTTWI